MTSSFRSQEAEIRKRYKWIKTYRETLHLGKTCLRCGISRPTLRKWLKRYELFGKSGLLELSRKPHNNPNRKINAAEEVKILELRKKRKLGVRRIQAELIRHCQTKYSLRTIHKVIKNSGCKEIKRSIKRKKPICRYEKSIPGERIQMDVCKISPGIYQYTAIDDCTRYRVLEIFKRRTAKNTLLFLDRVVEEMPFPIQRIQTDRGKEFFAYEVQDTLMEWGIKFRPIRPRSPHLNGKVERSQLTDLREFYSTIDLKSPNLQSYLYEWQHDYNWHRPHGSLMGKTPMEKVLALRSITPTQAEVSAKYDPRLERIQEQNYRRDKQIRQLQ